MSAEVHIFLGTAAAAGVAKYPTGERHAMHIYLRQAIGSEHDWNAAEAVALNGGWADVSLNKAGILPVDTAERKEEPERTCYLAALEEGDAILVYSCAEPQ